MLNHNRLWTTTSTFLARLSRNCLRGLNRSTQAISSRLDSAAIRRALVLSVAYQFGNPNKPAVEDEYAQVKTENDWTSRQVARFPDRLRGFCSVNPLKDYAIEELARCAKDPQLHIGLKLHFGNSDVDLDNPQHVERLRSIFRAANEQHMAIAVHMRSSVTRKRPYGEAQARVFLNEMSQFKSRILPGREDTTTLRSIKRLRCSWMRSRTRIRA